jgi:hypothetical protein
MKVIERVIKHQPPYYNTVPHEVSVKSDCIELRKWDVTNTIYYRNIGNVVLNKTDIWYAEINDRLGHWMCYVYSFVVNINAVRIPVFKTIRNE